MKVTLLRQYYSAHLISHGISILVITKQVHPIHGAQIRSIYIFQRLAPISLLEFERRKEEQNSMGVAT